MNDHRDHHPSSSFEFICDEDQLNAMIQADEREKTFYAGF